MDLLVQIEQLFKEIIDLNNREYSFEDCFENILTLLIQKTNSTCGCIFANFENTNKITSHCEHKDKCACQDFLFDFYLDTDNHENIFLNRQYILVNELYSFYKKNSRECKEEGIIYPLSDNKKTYGIICLLGSTHEKTKKLNELIGNTIIKFIVKIYNEEIHNLLRKYYSIETEISELTNTKADLNKISSFIMNELNLYSVSLLMYDMKLTCVDVMMSDSKFPIAVRNKIKNLHVDLKPNSQMINTLTNLQNPTVFNPDKFLNMLIGGEKDSFMEKTAEVLSNIKMGELLLSPSNYIQDEKKLFLVATKKHNQLFMKSQIDSVKKLTKIASLAVEKEMSEQINLRKANSIDVVQKISRRIIDDSDINVEADFIRRELQLHSCIIFALNRIEDELQIEGFSSEIAKSDSRIIKSITIKLESLYSAGYTRSDLHQLRITRINEYIELVEDSCDQNAKLLTILRKYQDYNVIQVPLFDSFRRLQGLFLFLKEPDQQIHPSETEIIKEFSSKIANAFEIRMNIYYDALTGLPNIKRIRPIVVDKLISSEQFSLIICKIINLKEIVITRGDEIVDKCMISITKEIKNLMLRQSENILISRNSGEASFIFIYPSIENKRLKLFSDELSKCITKPITINGNSINLYTSIGICHSTDIWDTEMVFNYSKLAIQSIVDQRNAICIFDAEMQLAYQKEKELEEDIRKSLSEKQFIAHYQPKVLCDGSIIGYEALVRWTRKDNIVLPGMFINKIEKMGMIQSLFNIVFEKICQDFAKSNKINNISINISPLQLAKKDLLRSISSIISGYSIEPQHITFEFVETAMLNSDYYNTIKELKKLGFKLSLDDFGTGYARYKTLIDLFNQGFVNEIKIDKVFIDDIESSANQNFIKSISYLAAEFNVSIVVEGVETIDQYSRIKSINPNVIIQGWLVSKALPLRKVELLNDQKIIDMFIENRV